MYIQTYMQQFVKSVNKIYIIRHGQSIWNQDSKFTGWTDIPLTKYGEQEAITISEKMLERNINPTIIFSSALERCISTANIMKRTLDNKNKTNIPLHTSWRLNEKHYGTLEGVPRRYIGETFGDNFTELLRSNYYMKPPIISDKYNNNFSVYENCYYESVKYGESKEDVLNRVLPYFENDIQYTLKNGKIPLIVSHKHCVRVLMKYLLNMDDYDFENYTFPPSSIMELEFDNKRNLKGYDIIKY